MKRTFKWCPKSSF